MIKHIKEYDDEIKSLVNDYPVHFSRMIKSTGAHKNRSKDRSYLLNYINDNTPKLQSDFYTLATKIYWILNDIEDFPKCSNPDCKNRLIHFNVKSLKEGYVNYCSRECQYNDKKWKDSVENGFKKKYGVKNYFMTDEFKKSHYGLTNEVKNKKYNTHKKNNSFKESEKENDAYRILLQKFDINDIYRQYSCDIRYPFKCDFYIKSIDTFIEYNGSWTHGNHPFNINDENDLKILDMWKNKNTKFYENAIETWTKRDIQKREYAIKNNLNFYEFWKLSDVRKFVGINSIQNLKNLDLRWNRKKSEYEFNYFLERDATKLPTQASKNNYIIKYFQQDTFFKKEKELWRNCPDIREKLISNRVKFLNKKIDELSEDDLLTGFKKSGLYYGYSHFNPLWFKWFINRFDVKICYDPCGGWGHRLLGGMNLEKYIYNDLSLSTKSGIDKMVDFYGLKNVVTHCNDARTFIPDDDFDAMFTCPPYYNVEKYECGEFKDISDFNYFMDSLFDVFMNKTSCKIFGLVIREDLLAGHDDYIEKYELNTSSTDNYLSNSKRKLNEFLYVFRK